MGKIIRKTEPEDSAEVPLPRGLEKDMYEGVKSDIENSFKAKNGNCHLEVTAQGQFSEALKDRVRHDIIFTFIKRAKGSEHAAPNITGFTKSGFSEDFITIELKNERMTLDDVYQTKKYADLFNAKYGILVLKGPVPTELKKLHSAVNILNHFMSGYMIYLAQFEHEIKDDSWFPESPFKGLKSYLPPYQVVSRSSGVGEQV